MTRYYRPLLILTAALALSACAQPQAIRQMNQQVEVLNQEVSKLSDQTVALAQQNVLNQHSTSGVWLLPGADAPAQLQSQIGTLNMTLADVQAQSNGTRATLRIASTTHAALPPFSGSLEYGELTGAADDVQPVNTRYQQINVLTSAITPDGAAVTLTLPGITPDRLGFVHIHGIQPARPR